MSQPTYSRGVAIFLGVLLGAILLNLGPGPLELQPVNSREASSNVSSESSPSSQQQRQVEKQAGSIVVFDEVTHEVEREEAPDSPSQEKQVRKSTPESSERANPSPQSAETGKTTLASNGQGTTIFRQVRDVPADKVMDSFGVWLMRGDEIVGEFLSKANFIKRSDEYYATTVGDARRLKASLSPEMVRAARRTFNGSLEEGVTAYVVLSRSDRQDVARQVRTHALERRIPSGQFWSRVKEVFLDIRDGSVQVTGVEWK